MAAAAAQSRPDRRERPRTPAFARIKTETEAAEESAQKEYDGFMTDSKVDKAQKTMSVEHKAAIKQDEIQVLTSQGPDFEGTQKELVHTMTS